MRSLTSSTPARRTLRLAERRTRRRPAIVAATLAVGLLATAGITGTAPTSQAEASGSLASFALASYSTAAQPTPAALVETDADTVGDAQQTLEAAEAAITAADTVAADITSSGLNVPGTLVDTAALEAATERLDRAQTLSAAFLPYFTEPVTALTATVDEQVVGLRGKLDAAQALKAEQEAAEKARLAAEAAAAAEAEAAAAAASQQSSGSGSGAPAPVFAAGGAVGGTSPADAQATARAMLGNYGWGDDQFGCLVSLWNKESGWNYRAYNASSGATGIPQALPGSKMASAGADWQTNPATQIAWGLGYISGRYGSPCAAWGHSQSVGWY
jgi:hypothetical protein